MCKLPFRPELTQNLQEIIHIAHNREQGVQCYETGCDWLRVEKGIPIGLKQVHSFTLRCLLYNLMGCHGDCMPRQVTWLRAKRAGASPGYSKTQRNKSRTCFIAFHRKRKQSVRVFVPLCVCVSIHTFKYLSFLFKFSWGRISFWGADGEIQGNLTGFSN